MNRWYSYFSRRNALFQATSTRIKLEEDVGRAVDEEEEDEGDEEEEEALPSSEDPRTVKEEQEEVSNRTS